MSIARKVAVEAEQMAIDAARMSITVAAENLVAQIREAPYEWWRRFMPLWIDVDMHDDGSITFTTNGKYAGGSWSPPSRRKFNGMVDYIRRCPAFNLEASESGYLPGGSKR